MVGRSQEFNYRLDGVLTRWEVFVEGLGRMLARETESTRYDYAECSG